jgi:hypothetical protein
MARPVLTHVHLLAAILVSLPVLSAGSSSGSVTPAAQSSSAQATGSSSTDSSAQATKFQQIVQGGPFYKELVRLSGRSGACQLGNEGENILLTCKFRDVGRFEARSNPAIEFSEQKIEVQQISRKKALALLRETEKYSFGPKGCSVNWNRAADSENESNGSREVAYRGDTCNCQGRLVYRANSVVGLIWRSAC